MQKNRETPNGIHPDLRKFAEYVSVTAAQEKFRASRASGSKNATDEDEVEEISDESMEEEEDIQEVSD